MISIWGLFEIQTYHLVELIYCPVLVLVEHARFLSIRHRCTNTTDETKNIQTKKSERKKTTANKSQQTHPE